MAFSHLHSTSVYVNDTDKAIDFYTNKLGFELRQNIPMDPEGKTRWVEVAPPGAQTAIVLIKDYADWSPERVGQNTGLVLTPDDTRATCEALIAKGVEFTELPNEQPWGIQAQFKDQDGNEYVVVGR